MWLSSQKVNLKVNFKGAQIKSLGQYHTEPTSDSILALQYVYLKIYIGK